MNDILYCNILLKIQMNNCINRTEEDTFIILLYYRSIEQYNIFVWSL